MPRKAVTVTASEKIKDLLQQMVKQTTVTKRLLQRCQIILLALVGLSNREIAERVEVSRKQVGLWRRRWQQSMPALTAIEPQETTAALRRALEEVLSDAPRAGSPGKFSAEQVTEILGVACETPELSGRPITHWTGKELADEVVKRGIVESISTSQIHRYLRAAALQPHRNEYWITTTEKDEQAFQAQVEIVCQTYLDAAKLYYRENTYTVCVDEMTSIQALQRNAEEIPMQPGQAARIEFEYTRNGTTCLIGNWDVVAGQMICPTLGPTRTEIDFAWHIHDTVRTDPDAKWVFVLDRLNIHQSEALVRYVACLEGIPRHALGKKGKSGILKSMATRREFLSEWSHRVRFVYLPKHSSWLNQIETIFGIIQRKALRRGSFSSVDQLQNRILEFIGYMNGTSFKPFAWTYTGRPLASPKDKRPKTWKEQWRAERNQDQAEQADAV